MREVLRREVERVARGARDEVQRAGDFFREHKPRKGAAGGRGLARDAADVFVWRTGARREPVGEGEQRLFRAVPAVALVVEVAVGVDLVMSRPKDSDRGEARDGVLPAELDLGGAVYFGEADAAVACARSVRVAGLLGVFLVDSLGDFLLFFFENLEF